MCAMKKRTAILASLLLLALGSGCAFSKSNREWGTPVGGLNASIELPQSNSKVGKPIRINVMVRNISSKPIPLFEGLPFFYELWVRMPSGQAAPAPINKLAFALYARKRWGHRLCGSIAPRYEDMAAGQTQRETLEYRLVEPIPPGSHVFVCVIPLAKSNTNGKFYSNEVLVSAEGINEDKSLTSTPYNDIGPVTSISQQAYQAKHKPWLLKPKRTGDIVATYEGAVILVNMGAGQMVEEGDEFIIYKGSRYKGSVKAINVFSDKSLCMVLYTSDDNVIAVGDKATTKLSE